MCEIFGAYSWLEGLKMMKWIADLMLVSGINYYVPHAFSPKFPDSDCPPHFYAHGTNPQYKKFRILMEYMNRVSHLISGGMHVPCAAILYHAEADWSDYNSMPCDTVARIMTENQLDFDIIPTDYLENAVFNKKKEIFTINNEVYHCLIIPECKYLPMSAVQLLHKYAENNVPVIFTDSFPVGISDVPEADITEYINSGEYMFFLNRTELAGHVRGQIFADVIAQTPSRHLRYYHYNHGDTKIYMFTNSDIHNPINTDIKLKQMNSIGDYAIYDALANKIYKCHTDGNTVPLKLEPYNSIIYVFGELPEGICDLTEYDEIAVLELDEEYSVSIAKEKEYPSFRHYKNITSLTNMAGKDEQPRFSGHYRYEKKFNFESESDKKYVLDLGYAGESATVYVNGINCGDRIAPPYEFDVTSALKNGENELCIDISTHYGYEFHDQFTRFFLIEPAGLLGKVKIKTLSAK